MRRNKNLVSSRLLCLASRKGMKHVNAVTVHTAYSILDIAILSPGRDRILFILSLSFTYHCGRHSHTIYNGGTLIDPSAVAQGVISGVITQKSMQKIEDASHPGKMSPQDETIQLLKDIKKALAPPQRDTIEETFQLQPYPAEYIVDNDFRGKSHCCVFFFAATPVRFDGLYGGTYQKSLGPGWFQLDIPGRLSTTDAQAHSVVVSYRDNALGATF